jgi:hypothetical protein
MAAIAEDGSISGAVRGDGFTGAAHKKGSHTQSGFVPGAAEAAPATDINAIAKATCFRTLESLC